MRELRDDLRSALELARPEGHQQVFAALCDRLSERRGRPVVLRLVEFPPGTASGLYLDMTDRDVICVQANTHPSHQLVIFGHEVWHMMAGHGGRAADGRDTGPGGGAGAPAGAVPSQRGPGSGRTAGPGSPAGRPDGMTTALQSLAARTDFRQLQETEAETFGLELGAHLRGWLDGPRRSAPRSALARRIQTSLGKHRTG
ncbi:hypothetical protein AB0G74_10440 [Streptomyces sp. NPDC020875]|uniref:hypothetical protein n=1 Tax=Streptomyces sp. NPDC020875 TaxID=3154898 RepID=UPI0033F5780E